MFKKLREVPWKAEWHWAILGEGWGRGKSDLCKNMVQLWSFISCDGHCGRKQGLRCLFYPKSSWPTSGFALRRIDPTLEWGLHHHTGVCVEVWGWWQRYQTHIPHPQQWGFLKGMDPTELSGCFRKSCLKAFPCDHRWAGHTTHFQQSLCWVSDLWTVAQSPVVGKSPCTILRNAGFWLCL